MYIYTHIYKYVFVYVYIYVYICKCCTWVRTQTHAHTPSLTHTCERARKHTRTNTYIFCRGGRKKTLWELRDRRWGRARVESEEGGVLCVWDRDLKIEIHSICSNLQHLQLLVQSKCDDHTRRQPHYRVAPLLHITVPPTLPLLPILAQSLRCSPPRYRPQ